MKQIIKIVFAFPILRRGEVYPWYQNIIRALRQKGYKVKLVFLPKDKRLIQILNFIGLMPFFFKQIKRANIVLIPTSVLIPLTFLVAKIYRKKTILLYSASSLSAATYLNTPNIIKKIFNSMEKFIYPKINLFITHSQTIRKELIQKYNLKKNKTLTLYSAIDTKIFKPQSKNKINKLKNKLNLKNEPIILYHGLFHPAHGLKYFIKAWNDIKKNLKEIRVVFVGVGKEAASGYLPKKFIKQEEIIFIPEVPNSKLPIYLSLADIWFGRFSDDKQMQRSFSPCMIEAMSLEKPVIVTPSKELQKFLKDGFNSLLVSPNNARQIYEKIIYCLKRKNELKQIGKNARKTILKNFTIEKIGKQLNLEKFLDL